MTAERASKKSRQHLTLSSNFNRCASFRLKAVRRNRRIDKGRQIQQDRGSFMKLTTVLYTAAFVLAPVVGFAADQGAGQQDSTKASDSSNPYPDWLAISKTAPQKSTDQQKSAEQSEPQKSTDQQKPAEQDEPSLLEKAKLAFEAISGACGQLRRDCLDEDDLGKSQSKCREFRATCGSNWLPRP
jgi:hypothetical protein